MKKVLLVTLQDVNTGNRLQNYALQTVLKKLGYEVHTPYYTLLQYNSLKKQLKCTLKLALGITGMKRFSPDKFFYMRKKRFEDFNKDYIDNMFKVSYSSVFKQSWERFDVAVSGSDQVWHRWSDKEEELKYFYLQFIPKEKRIAYAPSFGFEEFPQKDIDVHKEGILGMTGLSCREKNGQQLIEKLTGRKAELVIDPTMMLEAHEWKKISRKPEYISDEPFMLLYFLGKKTPEYQEAIKYVSEKYGLKIIDIYDWKNTNHFCTRPDEFLWLAEHAEMVYTDSFHACVFSMLFKTRFVVFPRRQANMENMFGRIETLLNDFSLTDHIYNGSIRQIDELPETNYDEKQLEAARNKAIAYLKKYL